MNQRIERLRRASLAWRVDRWIILGCLIGLCPRPSAAQPTDAAATPAEASPIAVAVDPDLSIPADPAASLHRRIGIQGRYRPGRWCGVSLLGLSADADSNDAAADRWSLITTDGDGVDVTYRQRTESTPGPAPRWAYAIPGTEAAPLQIRLGDRVVARGRFPQQGVASREPSAIPRGMPWVVVLGDPLGIDTIGENKLLSRAARVVACDIESNDELPDHSLGYSGVDLMVINAAGIDLLKSLSPEQCRAIVRWVRSDRGRLLITLGGSAEQLLKAAPWLLDVLPLSSTTPPMLNIDPAAVENFTTSQTRLEPFTGVRLPRDRGTMLINGRTTGRVATWVAARYVVGLGDVTVLAADADSGPFAAWPNRLDLITRLNAAVLQTDDADRNTPQRLTGFQDLAGQARATLDRFEIKRRFNFSVISLILMGFILLVGPIDFLLINRVLGRPLLGWLSLPIMAIAISGFLIRQSLPRPIATANDRDATIGLNRLEIIDVDTVDGVGRGFSWSYLYTHDGGRFDIQVQPTQAMRDQSATSVGLLTTPFGYAGQAFGGIQIESASGLPAYDVSLRNEPDNVHWSSRLRGLPIAPRASKSIASQIAFVPAIAQDITLTRRTGSELLTGPLQNPLSVDLLDGILVYRNLAYFLPTRLPANGRLENLSALRQKNFRWYLSRQEALESGSETEAWDPTADDDPMRVAEMLMFHDLVGGSRYTGLKHQAIGDLDWSNLLADDRCVLVARLKTPMTQPTIRPSLPIDSDPRAAAKPVINPAGEVTSLIRVILPVK